MEFPFYVEAVCVFAGCSIGSQAFHRDRQVVDKNNGESTRRPQRRRLLCRRRGGWTGVALLAGTTGTLPKVFNWVSRSSVVLSPN